MNDIDRAFKPARNSRRSSRARPGRRPDQPRRIGVGALAILTLFTTPVVYLYLDRLSNAFARWGRSSNPNHDAHLNAHGLVEQAAE